jgi:hypothetical protein
MKVKVKAEKSEAKKTAKMDTRTSAGKTFSLRRCLYKNRNSPHTISD